ncbi:MAG: hypothetical protein WCI87_06380 [Euryarchaeota archaeon]
MVTKVCLKQHNLKLADTVSALLNTSILPPKQEIPPQPLGPSPPPTTRRPSRRTLVLSVIVVLVAISVIAAGYYGTQHGPSPSPNPSTWPPSTTTHSGNRATYQNPEIGVKLTYPQNWTALKDPTFNGSTSNCYYYIYPTNRNNTLDSVGFYKVDKKGWLSDSDNNTSLNYLNSLMYYWNMTNTNVTIIQNATSTILGGAPAYKITVSFNLNKDPNDPHIFSRWFLTKGDYIYIASHEGLPWTFNRTLDTAELIVYSFEFI